MSKSKVDNNLVHSFLLNHINCHLSKSVKERDNEVSFAFTNRRNGVHVDRQNFSITIVGNLSKFIFHIILHQLAK